MKSDKKLLPLISEEDKSFAKRVKNIKNFFKIMILCSQTLIKAILLFVCTNRLMIIKCQSTPIYKLLKMNPLTKLQSNTHKILQNLNDNDFFDH